MLNLIVPLDPKLSFCTLNFEQYKYVKESKKELLLPDLTPAGVMGWLTGQKHKPISGEQISITVKFDHDCLIRNPKHQICFPVVGACAKEITFPLQNSLLRTISLSAILECAVSL